MANPHLAGENVNVQGEVTSSAVTRAAKHRPHCVRSRTVCVTVVCGRTPQPQRGRAPDTWGPVPVASKALTPEESGGEAEKQGGAYQAAGRGQPPRPAQQTLPGIPAGEENTGNPRQTEESLLMTVREESKKAGLKPNIQKTKIVASDPITSWEIDGESGNSG